MLRSAYGRQIIRALYLSGLVLFFFTLQSFYTGESQVVSLSFKEAPLQKVFAEIRRQTNYTFAYTEADLVKAKSVTIQLTNSRLPDALNALFADQPLHYTIIEQVIVVKQKAVEKKIIPGQGSLPLLPPLEVRGRVSNEQGEPVAWVSIRVKGTKDGTSTDSEGDFILKNIADNATLLLSGVNIEPIQVGVDGRKQLDIRVKGKTGKLDEVQVVAYGKTSQRYSVGNSVTVSGEVIDRQPVTNPLFALQGLVPGLLVTQKTGLANGAFTAQIQGQNSIGKGSDPLIVVDGVPLDYELFGAGRLSGPLSAGTGRPGNSPVNFINPSDIESITVLKDADATAIYGSRAANGAILITTKKGKAGKPKISLNMQHGWGRVGNKVAMLNTRQYLDMRYEAIKNDGLNVNSGVNYDLQLWDTTRYTDWQQALIGGKAKYTNIHASLSGGTELVQYMIGGTLDRIGTVYPGDFASKTGTVHFNLSASTQDQRLKLSLTSSYAINNNGVPGVDLTRAAVFLAPIAPPLFNKDGTLNWALNAAGSSTFENPLAGNSFEAYEHSVNTLTSNATVSYSVVPGLALKSSLGYNHIQGYTFWATTLQSVPPEYYSNSIRNSSMSHINSFTWIAEPQATFNKNFNNLSINALVGGTFQKSKSQVTGITASGFVSDLLVRDLVSATFIDAGHSNSVYQYNALFGRIGLIFDKKYIANFSARRDGSSRFGDDNPFNSFWSIGGGWIFTEEKFFNKRSNILSFGKIRGNYGVTGNDQIGDFAYLNTYSSILSDLPYQGTLGLRTDGLPNPYVQWETTRKLQGGIDLGFFKERLVVNVTYARNRSSNQLLSYPLPSITGVRSVVQNFPASVENTSWEIMVNATPLKHRQFNWTISANLTLPRNRLLKFPGIENTIFANPLNGVNIGQPLGAFPYYRYLGVDPFTGRYLLANDNQQPVFDGGPTVGGRTIFINTRPTLYGGISNTLNFKGFSLDLLLQFVRQKSPRSLYFWNEQGLPGTFISSYSNQPVSVLQRWQKPGDTAPIERFTSLPSGANFSLTDAYFSYDASYLRLKNLSLSWQIPSNWLKTAGMQGGSFYFSGQNLVTFTRYTGLDPESQSATSLPPLQMWTIGLNVTL